VSLPPYKPSFGERLAGRFAKSVLEHTIGAILAQWGPADLLIAINLDVDLVKDAVAAFPNQMATGRSLARTFPKVDEVFAEELLYRFIEKNYPHLFVWDNGGVKIEVLASERGKAWLFQNIKRFREYFWSS